MWRGVGLAGVVAAAWGGCRLAVRKGMIVADEAVRIYGLVR